MNINRRHFIPIYEQVKNYLKKEIIYKRRKPGEQLPPEPELAMEYNVSRMTLRKALLELSKEGLLIRRKGKGTFVTNTLPKKKTERKNTIGLIVPAIEHGIMAELIAGVEDSASSRGFNTILCNDRNNSHRALRYFTSLIKRGIDGILFLPVQNESQNGNIEIIDECKRNNVPIMLVDRYVKEHETDYIVTDNLKGAYELTKYLIHLGHRRIGLIAEPNCSSVEDRIEGYKKALAEAGIEFDEELIKRNKKIKSDSETRTNTRRLLNVKNRPTAIFAIHDLIARTVLETINTMGLRVPDDVSIVGFDDLDFARSLTVPLTTVRQPIYKMGWTAVEILIDKINRMTVGNKEKISHIISKPQLIIRKSAGIAPGFIPDKLKNVDFNATSEGKLPKSVLKEVKEKFRGILDTHYSLIQIRIVAKEGSHIIGEMKEDSDAYRDVCWVASEKEHIPNRHMVYGLHNEFTPGKYLTFFRLKLLSKPKNERKIVVVLDANVDVVNILVSREITGKNLRLNRYVQVPLSFNYSGGKLECRVFWTGNASLAVDCITLFRIEE